MSASLPTVVNSTCVPEDYLTPLLGIARLVQAPDAGRTMTPEEIAEAGKREGAFAIIVPGEVPITMHVLDSIPTLRIVANTAAGYNNLPLDELTRRGIWGTNTPDSFVHSTADATLALLLSVARKIAWGDRYVRSGEWPVHGGRPDFWQGMELRGKTWGIVGFGKIGEEVAKRAEAFGAKVIFTRRAATGDSRQRELPQLLAEADIVSLHTPLTPETKHLINAAGLALMKPHAILVNVARGPVVDEEALVAALKSGHLGGAGLDVFEDEPRVHSGLFEFDRVVLTPHLGGASREARKDARIKAAENIRRVILGERPVTPLNEPVL